MENFGRQFQRWYLQECRKLKKDNTSHDSRKGNSGRKKTVRTPENIEVVRQFLEGESGLRPDETRSMF